MLYLFDGCCRNRLESAEAEGKGTIVAHDLCTFSKPPVASHGGELREGGIEK